jgi:hypothetical protein
LLAQHNTAAHPPQPRLRHLHQPSMCHEPLSHEEAADGEPLLPGYIPGRQELTLSKEFLVEECQRDHEINSADPGPKL